MPNPPSRRAVLTGACTAALGAVLAGGAAGAPGGSGRRVLFGMRPADPLVMVGPDGSATGLEYEIILAAMAVPGHEVVPYFGTNARLTQALFRAAVDAIAPAVALTGSQFFLSDPYLSYANIAVSLARRDLRIKEVRDLDGLAVSAFQRARQLLGPDFAAAVEASGRYREEGQQHRQALALLRGRTDVIVGDRRILLHHLRKQMTEDGREEALRIHPLFPIVEYSAAFRERGMAADFNRGLATIRADGRYDAILDRYADLD